MSVCIQCLNEIEGSIIDTNLCSTCQEAQYTICRECGGLFITNAMIIIEGSPPVCRRCHYHYNTYCYTCGTPSRSMTMVRDLGISYCRQCADQHLLVCCECNDSGTTDFRDIYPGIFCPSCMEEHIRLCINCDSYFRLEEGAEDTNGDPICYNCESDCITWTALEFNPIESNFDEIQSKRTFGIEIETARCNGFSKLKNDTIWGCTNDYSIAGKEFITPPLYGDEGLKLIRDFCDTANSLGWEVDSHCGLHLHIGIKHFNAVELRSLAYAYHITYGIWSKFVSYNRVSNSMCASPSYPQSDITNINIDDLEDWEYFVAARDRFDAVNWRAFLVHGTIELRLMDGTLSGELICNWIKAHVRFIDFVTKHNIDELDLLLDGDDYYQFTAITEIIGMDLADYYAQLAHSHDNNVRHNEKTLVLI